ncbi:MAG: hypothetical protein R8K47_01905, partial [Mariprofundaceae bacterium]
MRRGLLLALAAAAALASLQLVRLDAVSLYRQTLAEWQAHVGGSVAADGAELVFVPQFGLRLQRLEIRMDGLRLRAEEALAGLRLFPLLAGKIEIDTLNVPDALLRVTKHARHDDAARTTFGDLFVRIAHLPLERLRLIRARLEDDGGHVLLDRINLDLRDPGANRETLWEVQAGRGNHILRAQGRIDFRRGRVVRGFGKFHFQQMRLAEPLALAFPSKIL